CRHAEIEIRRAEADCAGMVCREAGIGQQPLVDIRRTLGVAETPAGFRAIDETRLVEVVSGRFEESLLREPIERLARFVEHPELGADHEQSRRPCARSSGFRELADDRLELAEAAEIAIERKHLRPVDALRVERTRLLADLAQPLDLLLEPRPLPLQE